MCIYIYTYLGIQLRGLEAPATSGLEEYNHHDAPTPCDSASGRMKWQSVFELFVLVTRHRRPLWRDNHRLCTLGYLGTSSCVLMSPLRFAIIVAEVSFSSSVQFEG